MGIKLEDIEVKTENLGDMTFHKARLRLFVENTMPTRMIDIKNRQGQTDFIHHALRNKILEHVYGELIGPINELARMAAVSPEVDNVRLQQLRETIGTILAGKEKVEIIQ